MGWLLPTPVPGGQSLKPRFVPGRDSNPAPCGRRAAALSAQRAAGAARAAGPAAGPRAPPGVPTATCALRRPPGGASPQPPAVPRLPGARGALRRVGETRLRDQSPRGLAGGEGSGPTSLPFMLKTEARCPAPAGETSAPGPRPQGPRRVPAELCAALRVEGGARGRVGALRPEGRAVRGCPRGLRPGNALQRPHLALLCSDPPPGGSGCPGELLTRRGRRPCPPRTAPAPPVFLKTGGPKPGDGAPRARAQRTSRARARRRLRADGARGVPSPGAGTALAPSTGVHRFPASSREGFGVCKKNKCPNCNKGMHRYGGMFEGPLWAGGWASPAGARRARPAVRWPRSERTLRLRTAPAGTGPGPGTLGQCPLGAVPVIGLSCGLDSPASTGPALS